MKLFLGKYTDLHMHTNCSDGKLSVEKMLDRCQSKGYSAISITDHNTVSAYDILSKIDIKKHFSGKILLGCEFSCRHEGKLIHIVGYGFDYKNFHKYFPLQFSQYQEDKHICTLLLDSLIKLGLIDEKLREKYYDVKPDTLKMLHEELLQNQLFTAYAKINNIPTNSVRLFRGYLLKSENRLVAIDYGLYPSAEYVISSIKALNGITSLAHPYDYKYQKAVLKSFLNYFKDKVDAVEVYHNSCNIIKRNFLRMYAKKNKLLISGGNDDHGALGYKNNLKIPIRYFDKISARLKEVGKTGFREDKFIYNDPNNKNIIK